MLDIDASHLPSGVAPKAQDMLRHVQDVRRRLHVGIPLVPCAAEPARAIEAPDLEVAFASLAIGPCNAHAVHMAERFVCGELGDLLYIRGPVGVGKTLLLKAVQAALRCRSVDDVSARPQAALSALRMGGPLVLADCLAPAELEDAALSARCAGALSVVLEPLDAETSYLILARLRAALQCQTPDFAPSDAILSRIAAEPDLNGHTLHGVVYALYSAHLRGDSCAALSVPDLLRDLHAPVRVDGRIRIEDVVIAVCRAYEISRADLMSQRRTANVVRPRQIAMYLAKTLTLRSLPWIGHRFGGRDHTTVLHAVRKMDAQVQADPAFAAEMAALTETIVAVRP